MTNFTSSSLPQFVMPVIALNSFLFLLSFSFSPFLSFFFFLQNLVVMGAKKSKEKHQIEELKIVFLGEQGVGKTAIVHRYVLDLFVNSGHVMDYEEDSDHPGFQPNVKKAR
mmetsp:Transcript_13653/g.21151  ORF Transcript_13653/g.21151 Transcript_13653/m.21151 type:complete len:111 (+) Transcript_13653:254-586(+)